MPDHHDDDLIGRDVVIRSVAGIEYAGVVRSISAAPGADELFELGRTGDPAFQRFVYVSNRRGQIRTASGPDGEARESA